MHRWLSWIRRFNRCFTWSSEAYRLVPQARSSDHLTTIECTDAYSIGSSGATEVSLSWFLWLGFLHGLFNSCPLDRRAFRALPWDPRGAAPPRPPSANRAEPRRGGPSGLTTPIFYFSLSSLEPKSLRMVILTIILVQVLCCHSITKITRNSINGAMFVSNVRSFFAHLFLFTIVSTCQLKFVLISETHHSQWVPLMEISFASQTKSRISTI